LPPLIASLHGASAAWLALVPLLILSSTTAPGRSFSWCFVSGFFFWLTSLSWLLRLSSTWGSPPLVVLGWVAVSAYCAVYIGLFGFIASGLCRYLWRMNRIAANLLLILTLPIVWVGLEYLRSVLLTGFPWNALGVSQYGNVALIQLAEWGGVYAVSALIALVNVSLALTALRFTAERRQTNRRRRLHFELMLGLLVLALCWTSGVRRARSFAQLEKTGTAVVLGAVQPGIRQKMKWSEEDDEEIYNALRTQTELVSMGKPDLILWPETAIPALLRLDSAAQSFVADLTVAGSPLLVGSMDCDVADGETTYFNSSFLIDCGGGIGGEYRKQHLVPFGEFLPFENQIALIKRLAPLGFSCAPGGVETVFELPIFSGRSVGAEGESAVVSRLIGFSVLICFEDIHSYLARAFVGNGARLLINQTNDAWFEDSAGSMQHMAHCVFRGVENRVPVARCANTGVTCFIDRLGRIVSILRDHAGNTCFRGFKVSSLRVPSADMPLTFYTKWGDSVFALPCGVLTVLFFLLVVVRRKRLV